MNDEVVKTAWITPELVRHGDLVAVTQMVEAGGAGDALFSDGGS